MTSASSPSACNSESCGGGGSGGDKDYVPHSEVEKKRKLKISSSIQQLAALLNLEDQVGKVVCAC